MKWLPSIWLFVLWCLLHHHLLGTIVIRMKNLDLEECKLGVGWTNFFWFSTKTLLFNQFYCFTIWTAAESESVVKDEFIPCTNNIVTLLVIDLRAFYRTVQRGVEIAFPPTHSERLHACLRLCLHFKALRIYITNDWMDGSEDMEWVCGWHLKNFQNWTIQSFHKIGFNFKLRRMFHPFLTENRMELSTWARIKRNEIVSLHWKRN